jgi:hypothetical protein
MCLTCQFNIGGFTVGWREGTEWITCSGDHSCIRTCAADDDEWWNKSSRIQLGLPHSSLNTSAKQFSHKPHKNRKIWMTNILPSKSEYNHIILEMNLHYLTSNFLTDLWDQPKIIPQSSHWTCLLSHHVLQAICIIQKLIFVLLWYHCYYV